MTNQERAKITTEHEEKYEALAQEIGISKLQNIIVLRGLTLKSPLSDFDSVRSLVGGGLTLAQNTCVLKHVIKFH